MARFKEQPRQKIREKVSIPPELHTGLCEVWELVQHAERDPEEVDLDLMTRFKFRACVEVGMGKVHGHSS